MDIVTDQSSSQNIIELRQQKEFVGREEYSNFFEENLLCSPQDSRYCPVISLTGDGGVGKTWLMRRFQRIVENKGALTVFSDESEVDIPMVMGHVANKLQQRGRKFKKFNERYHLYQQKIGEVKNDPKAPEGLASLLAQVAVHAVKIAGDLAPTPGLSKALDIIIPWDSLEAQVDLWFTYLGQKITKKDDVRLMLQPIDILTPLFLSDLEKITHKIAPIVLFFDTYERTNEFLDPWLRNIFNVRYGILPPQVQFIIAGRKELDRNLWADYESVLTRKRLDIFTEEDVRKYMDLKDIDNPDVISVIMRLSNRLPLLVAILAAGKPDDPEKVGDPSGEAVERFLEWVKDPQQRQIALEVALSRKVNRDVVAVLVGEDKASSLFNWLKEMPFVEMRGDSWVYHDIVRIQMLRHMRRESPQGWITIHEKLASYYESLRDSLGLAADSGLIDVIWQGYSLENIYHHLCQSPHLFLSEALNGFLKALEKNQSFAWHWAETVNQATEDLESPVMQGWGTILTNGLKALQEDRYQEAFDMLAKLLEWEDLEDRCRAIALARRGMVLRLMGHYDESIADLSNAIAINDKDSWVIIQRGETYRKMGRLEEALRDFDQGITMVPKNTWAFVLQGEIYRQLGRYEEALTKYDQAIQLDSTNAWIHVLRSETYRQMGHLQQAMDGFCHAIELAPKYVWAITHRGEAYRQANRLEEALADFNRAIDLDPEYTWPIVLRGEAYRQMNRLEEALSDFCRAIEIEPKNPWPIVLRGEIHRLWLHFEDAIADYSSAIKIKPDYAWAITLRAEAYRQAGQHELALQDFNKSIDIQPKDVWTITLRGELYRQMGKYHEALADFDRALVLEPDNAWVVTFRGQTYCHLKNYDKAFADFGQAIRANPKYAPAYAQRGEAHRQVQKYAEALQDFKLAIELNPDDARTLSHRGEVYRQMGRFEEALSDFNKAIDLDPDDSWAIDRRNAINDQLAYREGTWQVVPKNDILEISYGSETISSQYAALHLNSSYFRLIYGPTSDWGTSVILLPVFWSQGQLYQGARVTYTSTVDKRELVLNLEGTISNLHVSAEVRLSPPEKDTINAAVKVTVAGDVPLDLRPDEAFKLIMLSSMHISPDRWDAYNACAGKRSYKMPEKEWIIQPRVMTNKFGLQGGSRKGKKPAPTIMIHLDQAAKITGWVTFSDDPTDDNIALWAASDELLHSWSYRIRATKE
jgi:tetratricopeptide (TPR) repeat protein